MPWWRRRGVGIAAAGALVAGVFLFQAYTSEWTGEWHANGAAPGYHRLTLVDTAFDVSGALFFFTSSLDPNFLFVGTAAPDAPRVDASFWMIRQDRLELAPKPRDYVASPNWFSRASRTSHDPRRRFDFRLSFRGLHFSRRLLAFADAGKRPMFRAESSYIGKRRLEVFKTGSAVPALILDQTVWNVPELGGLADVAHYDQAFGLLILKHYRLDDPALHVLDVNKIDTLSSSNR